MSRQPLPIPLGVKIFGIAVSLLSLLGLVAYTSQQRLRQVRQDIADLAEYIVPASNSVDGIEVEAIEQGIRFERIVKLYSLPSPDVARIQAEIDQFEAQSTRVDEEVAKALALMQRASDRAATTADRQKFRQLQPMLQQIEREHQDFHEQAIANFGKLAAEPGNRQVTLTQIEQLEQEKDDLDSELDRLVEALSNYTVEAAQSSERHRLAVMRNSLAIATGAIIAGILYASVVTFGVVRPLRYLTRRIRTLQQDSLKDTAALPVMSGDEVGTLTATFNQMLRELGQKERLKQLFGKYVDPRIVEKYETDVQSLQTSGEKQIITVLLCSVAQFDALTLTLPPERLVDLTNQALKVFSGAIADRQGFLDFVGTTIKAFWTPPFANEQSSAQSACQTALVQVAQLKKLKALLGKALEQETDMLQVDLQIGIATGPAIVANIGPVWSRAYTTMGDTVNTASRLQGVARQFGTNIVLLEATRQAAGEQFAMRELGHVKVVGKEETLHIHELLGYRDRISPEQLTVLQQFAQGLAAYRRQDWPAAKAIFTACWQDAADGPSHYYLELIDRLQSQSLPADWDGTVELQTK